MSDTWTHLASQENVHLFELPSNKIRLCLSPLPGYGVCTLDVVYHGAGSRHENLNMKGSAHILEHLLFQGSRNYNAGKKNGMWSLTNLGGASLNATTSVDRTEFHETMPTFILNDAIKREADRMNFPLLEHAEKESVVVHNEYERGRNDCQQRLRQKLFHTAFESSGYHDPTIGYSRDIKSILSNMPKLRTFFETHYTPDKCVVVVTGQFDVDEVKAQVAEAFGGIVRKAAAPEQEEVAPELEQAGIREFELHEAPVGMSAMGYKAPCGMTTDAIALQCLASIFNLQREGPFRSMIDRELTHSVYADFDRMKDQYLFTVWTSCKGRSKEALMRAENGVREVLQNYKITPEQLSNTKNAMRNAWTRKMNSSAGMASELAESISRSRGSPFDVHERFKRLDALTVKDLNKKLKPIFTDSRLTIGRMMPPSSQLLFDDSPVPANLYTSQGGAPQEVKTFEAGAAPFEKLVRSASSRGLFLKVDSSPDVHIHAHVPLNILRKDRATGDLLAAMSTQGAVVDGVTLNRESMRTELRDRSANVSVSCDSAGLHAYCSFPANERDVRRCLDIFKGAIQSPLIAAGDFKHTQQYMTEETNASADDVNQLSSALFAQNVFAHPQDPRNTHMPHEAARNLQSVTRADLQTLKKNLSDTGVQITCVAPTNVILRAVEAVFPKRVAPSAPLPPPSASPSAGKMLAMHVPGKTSTTFRMGCALPMGAQNPQFLPLNLAVDCLGGHFTSRLMQVVRQQKGLTYGAYAVLSPLDGKNTSVFQAQATFAPEHMVEGIDAMRQVVAEWRKSGITEEELKVCKTRALGDKQVAMDRVSGLASTMHSAHLMHSEEPVHFLSTFKDRVNAVTLRDVNNAIAGMEQDLVHVVVGTLPKQLPGEYIIQK